MPIITPPNYLVAPVTLPATTADPLTTEGGNTLDNGSGVATFRGTVNSDAGFNGGGMDSNGSSVNFSVGANFSGGTVSNIYYGLHNTSGEYGSGVSVTSVTLTSGTAITPNGTFDSFLSFQLDAANAGSWSLTFGPSTGAEYTYASGVSMVAGSQAFVQAHIPAGWKAVLTLTTVTVSNALATTH